MAERFRYVDAENGSDTTGNGTELSPYRTIQRGMNDFVAGDDNRIRLRGRACEYNLLPAAAGTSGLPLRLEKWPGYAGLAVIDSFPAAPAANHSLFQAHDRLAYLDIADLLVFTSIFEPSPATAGTQARHRFYRSVIRGAATINQGLFHFLDTDPNLYEDCILENGENRGDAYSVVHIREYGNASVPASPTHIYRRSHVVGQIAALGSQDISGGYAHVRAENCTLVARNAFSATPLSNAAAFTLNGSCTGRIRFVSDGCIQYGQNWTGVPAAGSACANKYEFSGGFGEKTPLHCLGMPYLLAEGADAYRNQLASVAKAQDIHGNALFGAGYDIGCQEHQGDNSVYADRYKPGRSAGAFPLINPWIVR